MTKSGRKCRFSHESEKIEAYRSPNGGILKKLLHQFSRDFFPLRNFLRITEYLADFIANQTTLRADLLAQFSF